MSSSKLENFGGKLRSLRAREGLTLKALAERLGMRAHGYLSELEHGTKTPTAVFVLRVARMFNVSTDQLLKDELPLPPHADEQDQTTVR